MIRFLAACLLAAVSTACTESASRPPPPTEPPPAGAATSVVPPAPSLADAELQRVSKLPDPCPGAQEGVRAADAELDGKPSSPENLFRLGAWLRLREATCSAPMPAARHADSALEAFKNAAKGAPGRREFVMAWAFLDSGDEASRAAEELLRRDPADPLARLWKARRPGTSEDEALALLKLDSGRCAKGQPTLLGDLLRRKEKPSEARAAYRRELELDCEAPFPEWRVESVSRRAAARVGLARVSLELREAVESMRQLRWLDLEAAEIGLHTVDAKALDELWARVIELDKAPRVARAAPKPELLVPMLELALLRGDLRGAAALYDVERASTRPPCQVHAESKIGPRAPFTACLLRELLPEAPSVLGCDAPQEGKTECRVSGRETGGRPWTLALTAAPGGGWRLAGSRRP